MRLSGKRSNYNWTIYFSRTVKLIMEQLDGLNRNELMLELRKHGLSTSGNKNVLKNRLRQFYEGQVSAVNVENNSVVGDTDPIQQIDRMIEEKANGLERLHQERLDRISGKKVNIVWSAIDLRIVLVRRIHSVNQLGLSIQM